MHVAIFFFLNSRRMSLTLFRESFVSFLICVGVLILSIDLIIFVLFPLRTRSSLAGEISLKFNLAKFQK
jgi:hypothetical protein